MRKLLLCAVIVFLGKGTSLQLVWGLLLCMAAHLLHSGLKPFHGKLLHALQHASLTTSWLTALAGLTLKTEAVGRTSVGANGLGEYYRCGVLRRANTCKSMTLKAFWYGVSPHVMPCH